MLLIHLTHFKASVCVIELAIPFLVYADSFSDEHKYSNKQNVGWGVWVVGHVGGLQAGGSKLVSNTYCIFSTHQTN